MEELDLKELISIFMKRKVLIILVVIIFGLLGAIYTVKFITPTYESFTKLILVQTGADGNSYGTSPAAITTTDVTLNSKMVENYKVVTLSESVLEQVKANLNLEETTDQLRSNIISVTTETDAEVLKVTVNYTDPEMAYKIATEVSNTAIARVEEIYKLSNLSILDSAKIATEPSNIHLAKNIVIFAFVGGILVAGYILLINVLDTTVKSDTDIEKAINVPVLASIVLTNETDKKNSQEQQDRFYRNSEYSDNLYTSRSNYSTESDDEEKEDDDDDYVSDSAKRFLEEDDDDTLRETTSRKRSRLRNKNRGN